MARSLLSTVAAMQREVARSQAAHARAQAAAVRQAERARAAAAREAERAQAAYRRAVVADARERARLYAEARSAECAALNEQTERQVAELESLLLTSLRVNHAMDFAAMKRVPDPPTWRHQHLEQPEPPPDPARFTPDPPSGMARMFGSKKYEAFAAERRSAYEQARAEHQQREATRLESLHRERVSFRRTADAANTAAGEHNATIDALRAAYESGDHDAVVTCCDLVLRSSPYPDGFPVEFRLAYVPASRQVVVEYELPGIDVVPAMRVHRYVKSNDAITGTARPATQIHTLYASVLAQCTLRTVSEIFESDRDPGTGLGRHIDVVVFNGMLSTTDRATGQPIRPCLITVRATRESFDQLNLREVDPAACLKHLSASVSRNAAELEAVRPVLEFSMVDDRFVAETDVLSGLDARPNLMELSPTEFEGLIQNLFAKVGLDTKQTRPSRDGGVDCVAFDQRAILGGKVVIQAKRYKNTVGVSAVRDLYGTVLNEGAAKGILVTTSGYGRGSYEFAKDKALELLDGANLLALLADHAGIEAKIVPPDAWHDPSPDQADETGRASRRDSGTGDLPVEPVGIEGSRAERDIGGPAANTTPAPPARIDTTRRSSRPRPRPAPVRDTPRPSDGEAHVAGPAPAYRCANASCDLYGARMTTRQCPACFHYATTT